MLTVCLIWSASQACWAQTEQGTLHVLDTERTVRDKEENTLFNYGPSAECFVDSQLSDQLA